jgi:predicted enzyme related to lactoylglutathione lyase
VSQREQVQRIDYIEFPTADIGRSRAFYETVFGWRFQDWGPDYQSFDDGRLTGGLRKTDSTVSECPLVVIYAVDLEAAEAAVKAGGGEITEPVFSFPGGRRFHFRDPAGHILAVWSDSEGRD